MTRGVTPSVPGVAPLISIHIWEGLACSAAPSAALAHSSATAPSAAPMRAPARADAAAAAPREPRRALEVSASFVRRSKISLSADATMSLPVPPRREQRAKLRARQRSARLRASVAASQVPPREPVCCSPRKSSSSRSFAARLASSSAVAARRSSGEPVSKPGNRARAARKQNAGDDRASVDTSKPANGSSGRSLLSALRCCLTSRTLGCASSSART